MAKGTIPHTCFQPGRSHSFSLDFRCLSVLISPTLLVENSSSPIYLLSLALSLTRLDNSVRSFIRTPQRWSTLSAASRALVPLFSAGHSISRSDHRSVDYYIRILLRMVAAPSYVFVLSRLRPFRLFPPILYHRSRTRLLFNLYSVSMGSLVCTDCRCPTFSSHHTWFTFFRTLLAWPYLRPRREVWPFDSWLDFYVFLQHTSSVVLLLSLPIYLSLFSFLFGPHVM